MYQGLTVFNELTILIDRGGICTGFEISLFTGLQLVVFCMQISHSFAGVVHQCCDKLH